MDLDLKFEQPFEFHPTEADWDVLQRVRSLCPPPEVALQVIEMARDPNVNLGELARCIELDPTLTVQLLRTVNSAHFGLSTRINSVARAVSLLGIRSLRMLTAAFGMLNPFSANLPHALYQSYWRKSLTVALVARQLAGDSHEDACVAFTAGLLADIGVLALAQVEGPEYHRMYHDLQSASRELIAAENLRYGTDHLRVGGLVLGEFGLDSLIVQAIISLGEPEGSAARRFSRLARILTLAQSLGGLLAQRDPEKWRLFREQLFQEFRVDTDALLDLMARVGTELHEWGKLFKLDVPKVDEARFRETAAAALVDLSMEGAMELAIFESVFGKAIA